MWATSILLGMPGLQGQHVMKQITLLQMCKCGCQQQKLLIILAL